LTGKISKFISKKKSNPASTKGRCGKNQSNQTIDSSGFFDTNI